jgi:hypothetical protein
MRGAWLVVIGLTACGPSCNGGDAVVDEPPERPGPPPLRPLDDAGPEAPAAEDGAAAIDASSPPPGNPFAVGKWRAVPGMPPFCGEAKMAEEPEALASKWVPCASGRAGCQTLDTSWTSVPGAVLRASWPSEPARIVDGKAYIHWRRGWPVPLPVGATDAYLDVIEPVDGPPVFAMGQRVRTLSDGRTHYCPLRAFFGDHGVGYVAAPRDAELPEPEDFDRAHLFGWAAWSDTSSFTVRNLTSTELGLFPNGYFTDMTAGARGLWLKAHSPSTIVHFDFVTETAARTSPSLHSETPQAIPGGAVIFDARTPYAIASMKEDGTWQRLVTPTSPQYVTSKALDRSAGPDLVWVESDFGANYSNPTLWTAPLAASEAGIVRRKVAKLPDTTGSGGARGVANRGVPQHHRASHGARDPPVRRDGLAGRGRARPGFYDTDMDRRRLCHHGDGRAV